MYQSKIAPDPDLFYGPECPLMLASEFRVQDRTGYDLHASVFTYFRRVEPPEKLASASKSWKFMQYKMSIGWNFSLFFFLNK